jgi:hypothetical protein
MQATLDDCFVVFVRDEFPTSSNPEMMERELVRCSTKEEAHWVQRECEGPHRKCIVRYVGPTGGGD